MNTLDESMLLRSMVTLGEPVSAAALMRLWNPTWQIDEIQKMLDSLAKRGAVQRIDGCMPRFVATEARP
ncbi:MAG: hypothetical protein KA795_05990 [Burkholderiaceae bacterium]|nr:hypothetical protein [Burkholderiaceae bacterium]